MIEITLFVLFFISVFAIIKSARGERSEENKGDKKRELTSWIETMKRNSGPDDYYYSEKNSCRQMQEFFFVLLFSSFLSYLCAINKKSYGTQNR